MSTGPIYVWRYVLRSRTALNARSSRRQFEGALLRAGDGFGCLHPWPELGDPELETLLCELKHGDTGNALVERALVMAERDEALRSKGTSFFKQDWIPVSHATLPEPGGEAVEEAVRRGFGAIKIKGSADYVTIADRIDELSRRWPALRWRVDFNRVLNVHDSIRFGECLSNHARERIDFLEDPCPYVGGDWSEIHRKTKLRLAMDHDAPLCRSGAEVLVVKPARERLAEFSEGRHRLVVTSNMEHPLGQCFAADRAGLLNRVTGRVDCCGLQTHELFERDEFSERLGRAGPRFRSPGGLGLGFDDLLEKLPWKRLN